MPQQKWEQQKFRGFQYRAVQLTERILKSYVQEADNMIGNEIFAFSGKSCRARHS